MVNVRNQPHFYMVTFDIINSRGKESLYHAVEKALKDELGDEHYYRVVKQCVLVETLADKREIGKIIKGILGNECNILIVRLQPGQAYRIVDPAHKANAAKFFKRLNDYEGPL